MTQKLYYNKPTLQKWNTSIIDIQEIDGRFHVKLEDSAFYPEGGGQPSDFGTIAGINIIELIDLDSEVIHVLNEKPKNLKVECEITWDRRIDHMQHHSGQHLLSATIIELFDIPTISFHLGKETVTIDLETPSLSQEQIIKIERAVYQKILENKEIKTYFVDKERLETLNLRKLPKVDKNIRIVEITDIDISACCGTHVNRTGEIGLIKLIKTEKVRQSTRLHFKCGYRALEELQKTSIALTNINLLFNTHTEVVKDKIEQTINELKDANKEIERLKEVIFDSMANDLISNSKNGLIAKTFEEESVKDLQILAKKIQTKKPSLIIFASLKENKLLFINQTEAPVHCGEKIKLLVSKIEGKGGGNANQAQVTFGLTVNIQEAIQILKNLIDTEVEV